MKISCHFQPADIKEEWYLIRTRGCGRLKETVIISKLQKKVSNPVSGQYLIFDEVIHYNYSSSVRRGCTWRIGRLPERRYEHGRTVINTQNPWNYFHLQNLK